MRGTTIEGKARNVERITGCVIQILYDRTGKPLSFKAFTDDLNILVGEEYIGTRQDDDERALRLLHTAIYRAHGKEAYGNQEGKCALCGKNLNGMAEVDHIKTRAKGRDDRLSNLRCLCSPCHRKRHGG